MISQPIYSVLVQWSGKTRWPYTIKTKWVEIVAPDIVIASELALKTENPHLIHLSVSMIWPKTERRSVNGESVLVHLFNDGAKRWLGDKLGWVRV